MNDHNSADRGSGGSAESSARNAQTGAPYTERNSEKDDGAWLIDEEEISDNVHRIVENAVYHRRARIAGSPYDSAADKQEFDGEKYLWMILILLRFPVGIRWHKYCILNDKKDCSKERRKNEGTFDKRKPA